jgi:monofunctional glycosyltransferase
LRDNNNETDPKPEIINNIDETIKLEVAAQDQTKKQTTAIETEPQIAPPKTENPNKEVQKPQIKIRKPNLKKRRGGILKSIFNWSLYLGAITLIWVILLRFVPIPFTYLMVQRAFEGDNIRYHPIGLKNINKNMVAAVIAAEDARFCQHNGFEIEAMKRAMRANNSGKKLRGASTITQQTAKNVFLWPSRSYIRKGFEAGFSVLIETIWGKRRIMEAYLNVAEMGNGVFGVQAAAQYYFNKSAKDLTLQEASRLAAILPSPQKWRVNKPSNYVARRSSRIAGGGRVVIDNNLYQCVYK